jgi:hypothetical protein
MNRLVAEELGVAEQAIQIVDDETLLLRRELQV